MARIVSKETGAIAPNKAGKSSKGKGQSLSGPGSREPKQKPEVVAFNESTVDAINKAGPKGHEVAHISPREGRLLKTLGGSGKKDPKTKILSYEIVGGKGNKLPKGKGRGRVDSTHQVAVLTDPEVEALNTMRWRDKDRGYSSGSGPEIMALADQNDRPFDFLEYRGERIPTLNDSGDENVKGDSSGGYTYTGDDSSGGGGPSYQESPWAKKKRLEKEARDKADKDRPIGTYYDGKIWTGTTWVDPKSKEAAVVLGTKYGDKDDDDGTVWDGNTWVNQDTDEGKTVLGLPTEREEKITSETERLKKKREDKERPLGTTNEDGKVWTGYGKGWKDPDSNEAAIASGVVKGNINPQGDKVWSGTTWVDKDSDAGAIASGVENGNIKGDQVWSGEQGTWVDLNSDAGNVASGTEVGTENESGEMWNGSTWEDPTPIMDTIVQDADEAATLDLEGSDQDIGTYYDFDSDKGDKIGGPVAGMEGYVWQQPSSYGGASATDSYPVLEEDFTPEGEEEPFTPEEPLSPEEDDFEPGGEGGPSIDENAPDPDDDESYDSSQDDPSGEADPDFWSDPGEYAGGDDWLEGEGEWGLEEDPYAGDDESGAKDSETLSDEAEDAESDLQFLVDAPDDDDTDTFDSSGQDDPADIQPDDDDTDTDDTSGYDPSLGNIYYGEDDDTDTFDSNEDAGGTTLYDPYTGDSEDDLGNLETDPTDDPEGSGDDGTTTTTEDGDGGTDTTTTTQTFDGNLSEEEKAGLLEELDKKYGEYADTDYEKLFHDEFADDLKEDYGASKDSAERAFLMSGDLSEFNTRGNTVNDQLIALEESLGGEQQDRLDKMATNYASGPKKAMYDWYVKQKNKIQNLKKDEDGNLIGDPDWDELDLSEWADPSENFDPEFFQDVDYSKLYEDDPVAEDIGGEYYDPEGTDPTFTALGYKDDDDDPRTGDLEEGGPTQEQHDVAGDDPVPDDFSDEGTGVDGMGDFGDETLEGVDFGDEYPGGGEDPNTVSTTVSNAPLDEIEVGDGLDSLAIPPIEETTDDTGIPGLEAEPEIEVGDELEDLAGGEGEGTGITEPVVELEAEPEIEVGDELEGLGTTDELIDFGDVEDASTTTEAIDTTPVTDGTPGMYGWIDDDRIPSQTEIDYYMDLGGGGEVTQDHVDEIQETLGVNPGDSGYIFYDESNLGTEMADPVFDVFEDEGSDKMDFGDETLGGFDFGDEFPPGYVDPEGITGSTSRSAPSADTKISTKKLYQGRPGSGGYRKRNIYNTAA